MDIVQLRTLVSVAELGSLNKAAERLRIAQPALSRQVRLLEAELGVLLFDRHGRGMVPTPAGLKVLARAIRILDEFGAIRGEAQQEDDAEEIVLGLPSNIAMLTIPVVKAFSGRFPRKRLRLVSAFSGQLAEWLQQDELDLSLMYEQDRSTTLRLKRILSDKVYAISVPDLMMGIDEPASLRDFRRRPLILPSHKQSLRRLIDAAAQEKDISLDVRFEVDDFNTIRDLVLAGFGIALVPPIGFEEYIEAGKLSAIPVVEGIMRNLVMGHRIDSPPSAVGRDLSDIVCDAARQLVRDGRWLGSIASD